MPKKGLQKTISDEPIEFPSRDMSPATSSASNSSPFAPPADKKQSEEERVLAATLDGSGVEEKRSPIFKLLAEPTLPPLGRENRAWLQMQTPNRLFFYWSLKENPFKNLNRILGVQAANYTLVLKLVDLKTEEESLAPVEAEGTCWFDGEAERGYRAEIGLYASNRPYVRILFSNTVETPRRGPSPRPAETAEWRVTADTFSKVLDVSGFSRDAFDVALAGDEPDLSETAARAAFEEYFGERIEPNGFSASDLRLVLLSIAAGASLESIRGRIGPALFALLQTRANAADAKRAAEVLNKQYEIDADEFEIANETEYVAVGGSLVNFPRKLRTRRSITDHSPLSSHAVSSR